VRFLKGAVKGGGARKSIFLINEAGKTLFLRQNAVIWL
jgi:hypothetical protein